MILLNNIREVELSGNELKNYRRKKKILNLLYQNETLPATTLSKKIGVSLPTAISLLKELSSNKLVESRGPGESQGGRKPMLFGLKNDSIMVVACELGHLDGKIGIYDAHNRLVAPAVEFETSIDDPDLVEKAYAIVKEIIVENNIDHERIFGVGMAMPGLVDSSKGYNYSIKNEIYRNIQQLLEKKFDRLVYVNNDARMQAYGEFIFGEAAGYNNALIINWNWGLGMGMILNGKLYNGATGFAGELSHIKFVDNGKLCRCGKIGCLETVTSAYVLIERAKDAVKEGRISQLTQKFTNREDDLTVEAIIEAAKTGDEFSIALLNSVGLALGKALSNTIQLLNPDVIVIGGVISGAEKYILTPIQQAINQYSLEQISGNTKIVISKNWKHAGLQGVTAMLYRKLFGNMYK